MRACLYNTLFKGSVMFKMFVFFILFPLSLLFAQAEMQRESTEPISFYIDVVNLQVPNKPDMSRLNTYVQVRYDDLYFVKTDDGFESSYECTAVIYDEKDDFQVDGRIWKETVNVKTFDQTNDANTFASTFARFDVPPADYLMVLSVQDIESGNKHAIKFKIKARDFTEDPVTISQITFLSDIEYDSLGVKSITPVVSSRQKGLSSPAFAFFEIYNQTDAENAEIKYEIRGINTRFKLEKRITLPLNGQRTMASFELPVDSLKHDIYELKIDVRVGKNKDKTVKNFYIRWEGIPLTAQDLATAIKQMEYVASPEEWKRIQNAPQDEKLEAFNAFWKRHDPTPGTAANEAMDSHYARVEYANQHFSAMQHEGWRTDRGMLFIVLGPPDDIVRDPYPSDSRPWEIWSYYRISRRFEFIDITGFGDYRFYRPYSMYELQMYMR